jgi:hypothetical protein
MIHQEATTNFHDERVILDFAPADMTSRHRICATRWCMDQGPGAVREQARGGNLRRTATTLLLATVVSAGFAITNLGSVAVAGDQLTKKQFLKAGNATCRRMWKAVEANFAEQFAGLEENEQPTPAQIDAAVSGLVEMLKSAVTDIEALQGPAGLEQKVDKFLDRFSAVVDEFEAKPQSAFEEELSGYPFAKPDKLASSVGLRACVQRG